ncbi:mediator of RNA polymerase II transcription subunit 15 [Ischnura elegans]|uniref:mediator of RNA polymerase II transcription subunit 15 n=1 Tax=Ischnura elegans TaxID=197161 RepID=UPI001ED88FA3|nr:mediator of RNA polymerase II transcription subunit 15 [Ischnura elegans]
MAAEDTSWRTTTFRQSVVTKIDEAIRRSGMPTSKNSMEMENHVFQKAKSREEYLSFVARLILHVREMNTKKATAGMAGGGPGAGGQGMPPDPINALQTLARQGSSNPTQMLGAQLGGGGMGPQPPSGAMQMGMPPGGQMQQLGQMTATGLLQSMGHQVRGQQQQQQPGLGAMAPHQAKMGPGMGMTGPPQMERYETGGESYQPGRNSQEEGIGGMVKVELDSLQNPADTDASFSGDKDVRAEGDIFEILKELSGENDGTTTEIPFTPNNATQDCNQQPVESNRAGPSTTSSPKQPSRKRKTIEEAASLANKKTAFISRQLEIIEEQHRIKMEILQNELKNSALALENQKIDIEIKNATLAKLKENNAPMQMQPQQHMSQQQQQQQQQQQHMQQQIQQQHAQQQQQQMQQQMQQQHAQQQQQQMQQQLQQRKMVEGLVMGGGMGGGQMGMGMAGGGMAGGGMAGPQSMGPALGPGPPMGGPMGPMGAQQPQPQQPPPPPFVGAVRPGSSTPTQFLRRSPSPASLGPVGGGGGPTSAPSPASAHGGGSIPSNQMNQMAPSPAMVASPSPQMTPLTGPPGSVGTQQRSVGMAPSPSSCLNTPGQPVGGGPSPCNPVEDQAYREKVRQLSKYIEPLRRMIARMGNDDVEKLSKMKKLLEILSNPSKRMPLETLLKCEVVLEKLDLKRGEGGSVGPSLPPPLPPPIQLPSLKEHHFFSPLLEAVSNHLHSLVINHTLQRTFGPSMEALFGPEIKMLPPPMKRNKVEEPANDVPEVLQGEIARLDQRFKVSLDPTQHPGSKAVHLVCWLDDRHLPCVPPISLTVPGDYPSNPPKCELSPLEYGSTPFLSTVQKALWSRIGKLPSQYSVSQLLDTWEMSVRQASSPASQLLQQAASEGFPHVSAPLLVHQPSSQTVAMGL